MNCRTVREEAQGLTGGASHKKHRSHIKVELDAEQEEVCRCMVACSVTVYPNTRRKQVPSSEGRSHRSIRENGAKEILEPIQLKCCRLMKYSPGSSRQPELLTAEDMKKCLVGRQIRKSM